jgi:hypothetical protein
MDTVDTMAMRTHTYDLCCRSHPYPYNHYCSHLHSNPHFRTPTKASPLELALITPSTKDQMQS